MKVRIYSPFSPFPATEGGFRLVVEQERAIRDLGHDVQVVSWKSRKENWAPNAVERTGRVIRSVFSELASSELFHYPPGDRARAIVPADLGIFHYSFAYSWLRDPTRLSKRTAVLFQNLESDLFTQRAQSARATGRLLEARIHEASVQKLLRHETELAQIADELWFVSPVDESRYLTRVPHARGKTRLTTPTFGKEVRERRVKGMITPASRKVLGFIGGMDFGPNYDSARWVIEELAPRLEKRGFQGELQIVGRAAPPELVSRAARYSWIRFLGFVEDIEEFWGGLSYLLVPSVSGSGVRIKLLEGIASGVPVITHSEAVLRIHPGLQSDRGVIAIPDPDQWAEHLVRTAPMSERAALSTSPFPEPLLGSKIYSFLAI